MTGDTLGTRLEQRMRVVGDAGLDGWLIADFRWNNPLFARFLGLQSGILTRRAFLWLPAHGHGEPRVLASRVDGHTVTGLDCPVTLYGGYEEMAAALQASSRPAGAWPWSTWSTACCRLSRASTRG